MAISKTRTLLAVPFLVFTSFLLLLNNVESDSFSFSIPTFEPNAQNIIFVGDTRSSQGVIELTKKDKYGKPLKNSVGQAIFFAPINLYDKKTGKVADFTTEFSFVVNPKGSKLHGDGMAFFLLSIDADLEIPKNSTGGFLGLFSPETAFGTYSTKNQILAVEFDSFGNEWDPKYPHIGIDINSIKSEETVGWPVNLEPEGAIGKARISYESKTKKLSVVVGYTGTQPKYRFSTLSRVIDLTKVLPEWVLIGFSAATGELAETHDVLAWSFSSNL